MKTIWKVEIFDREEASFGWGNKVEETKWFASVELATEFINGFNNLRAHRVENFAEKKAGMPYGIDFPEEFDIVSTQEEMTALLPSRLTKAALGSGSKAIA